MALGKRHKSVENPAKQIYIPCTLTKLVDVLLQAVISFRDIFFDIFCVRGKRTGVSTGTDSINYPQYETTSNVENELVSHESCWVIC